MSAEVHPKKRAKAARPFTVDDARASALEKALRAGTKGVLSFFPPKTPEEKKAVWVAAVEALEREGAIIADRRNAKARFFAREHAPVFPTAESVALKLAAAAREMELLSAADLKKALGREEKSLFLEALDRALAEKRLLEMRRKASVFYVGAEGLRTALGGAARRDAFSPERVRELYAELVRSSGFPDVPISALQQASGAGKAELEAWIRQEHLQGRIVLSLGDWSLADEARRAAAVEIGGDRYLYLRLKA